MARNNAPYSATITLTNADDSPYDLTGASLQMQAKSAPGSSAALTCSTANGSLIIQNPPTAGIVQISVPVGTMNELSAGSGQKTYYCDLLLMSGTTVLAFLGAWQWLVEQGITQSTTPVLPGPLSFPEGSDIALVVPADSLTLTLAPSGPVGPVGPTGSGIPTYTSDPSPGAAPIPYMINVGGSWFFRIMNTDGLVLEFPLP